VAGTVGGRPLIHRNVYRLLQKTFAEASLPHQRLYAYALVTYATCAPRSLLAQGASMREVMEVLGHSQMSLTSDTYTHVYDTQG
jgi:integrase